MQQLFRAGLAAVISVWAGLAWAQATFVQIEAHPNLTVAQDRARAYAANLPDVNGFRLGSGWYAISLGPYNESRAIDQIQSLKATRRIPADSFLVDRTAYVQQFFPLGSDSLTAAPQDQPGTETASLDQPAAAAPAIPEETRREALRSENELTRQQKFDLQIALQWFGFYDGAIDAAFGPGTRNSMAAWQVSKGYEATGVLTTRQRAELTGEYRAVFDSLGLATVRDARAGIALELPQAMVEFDRYDPPFAHFGPKGDSGVKVLLISQMGDENTLLGLYDIMQTLEIVPLEGERTRSSNRFTLTGENGRIRSYTHAELTGGAVKGFTLIWPAGEDRRFDVALKAMRDSFTALEGAVLPDTVGEGALEQSIDLLSGLKIRRPQQSRSGFYIDARGMVLTTADAVASCTRITLDEVHEAEVVAEDRALGLALLRPAEVLAPLDYARFQPGVPRLQSEVAVSGYSFEGMLGAPTLTFGTLADLRGLGGEATLKRLALAASPGDAGGPVFDTSGSVLGMLLPTREAAGKRLPDDVSFAADALAIAEFLSNSGYAPAASDRTGAMSAEDLTDMALKLTVLVSCWDE